FESAIFASCVRPLLYSSGELTGWRPMKTQPFGEFGNRLVIGVSIDHVVAQGHHHFLQLRHPRFRRLYVNRLYVEHGTANRQRENLATQNLGALLIPKA